MVEMMHPWWDEKIHVPNAASSTKDYLTISSCPLNLLVKFRSITLIISGYNILWYYYWPCDAHFSHAADFIYRTFNFTLTIVAWEKISKIPQTYNVVNIRAPTIKTIKINSIVFYIPIINGISLKSKAVNGRVINY